MPDNPMDVIRMALDREKVAYRNYTEYARIATQPGDPGTVPLPRRGGEEAREAPLRGDREGNAPGDVAGRAWTIGRRGWD